MLKLDAVCIAFNKFQITRAMSMQSALHTSYHNKTDYSVSERHTVEKFIQP
jgi:hypothetical protein